MSKARNAVMKIVSKQLTVAAAAAEYGFSRRHLHRHLGRYRDRGLDAVEPRSRAPRSSPQRTEVTVRERILQLRAELTANGLDAGPVTIAWHLEHEGLSAATRATTRKPPADGRGLPSSET